METNSLPIQNDTTSRKKLWNLQQGTIGNCRSLNKIEAISTECDGTIWNLDRLQKPQVL